TTPKPLSCSGNFLQPGRPAELADQRARGRLAAVGVEDDLAVAERQRASGDHQARPAVVAFELQDQAARQVFDDLLLDRAQRTVRFDRHAFPTATPVPRRCRRSDDSIGRSSTRVKPRRHGVSFLAAKKCQSPVPVMRSRAPWSLALPPTPARTHYGRTRSSSTTVTRAARA